MNLKRTFLTLKLGLAFFIVAILLRLSYSIVSKIIHIEGKT